MFFSSFVHTAMLLIVFEVVLVLFSYDRSFVKPEQKMALGMAASVSSSQLAETRIQEEHIANEECSFLVESDQEECDKFWAGKPAPVILISLDGFRPEYLSRLALDKHKDQLAAPTLNCLSKHGVFSPSMMPSYPTITFPNHYSIATGLYPESHEIIGNQFYDPDLKAAFNIRNADGTDPKWWTNGEPIWTTVRRQNKISATYFWPGSDVKFPDVEQRQPNYFFNYNKSTSFKTRVDQVLEWIDLPIDRRPALTTLYFEEPDGTGHKEGPNSAYVTAKVTEVDSQIRRLIDGLTDRNVSKCVNVIVVSDHGMADSPPGELLVDLQKYVPDIKETTLTFYGPVPSIRPINDTIEEEERIGNALACQDSHMRVFNKWELPYRMHSARSRRIPKLMLDMDLSWRGVAKQDSYTGKGAHGWDNLYLEMQAIFIAHGPSFKSRTVVRPFENVQLYNLMCALVNVTPAENNGTWGALHHLLVDPPVLDVSTNQEFPEMPPMLRAVPGSEGEIISRTACDLLNNRETGKETSETNVVMNMTEEREIDLLAAYAPLGIPVDLTTDLSTSNISNHVLLVNEDYLTGYDVELGVPLWTAYTVSGEKANKSKDGQWIEDPRLELNHTGSCQRLGNIVREQEIVYTHLFPEEFSSRKEDTWLDTNLLEVPSRMSSVIQTMTQMLVEAATIHGSLNVISGPTRHHSAALFYIITACSPNSSTDGSWNFTTCPIEHRDLQAFLLPVRPTKYHNCFSDQDFIAFNVATLKDVEFVTDFIFFPDLPIEDKLSLLTKTTLESKLVLDPTRRSKT